MRREYLHWKTLPKNLLSGKNLYHIFEIIISFRDYITVLFYGTFVNPLLIAAYVYVSGIDNYFFSPISVSNTKLLDLNGLGPIICPNISLRKYSK